NTADCRAFVWCARERSVDAGWERNISWRSRVAGVLFAGAASGARRSIGGVEVRVMAPVAWERLRVAVTRLAGSFSKSARDAELDEELSAHLEALAEENVRRGMTVE